MKITVALCGAVAVGGALLPQAAEASSTSNLVLAVQHDGQGRPFVSLPANWGIGHCTQLSGSTVTWEGTDYYQDTPKGAHLPHARLHWVGSTKTNNDGDQWFQSASFLDGNGKYLFGASFNSDKMYGAWVYLTDQIRNNGLDYDPTSVGNATQVEIAASC
ncbi:hypothetical protein EBO15_18295 [Actinomadura harenae]|uniref:Uncharacterized protein n=2 Tax=Actinomadura harenae TaxID=2483351 RepID=A0A3M2LZR3_9ACTN|nr:hypothetical protein EBO15_18295 [Actinomadura harenae]